MRLTIVGSGDAFGSGGRGTTCFWIESQGETIVLDFGAGSLAGVKRLGLDPGRIDIVVLSHLHGDHFGGLPFLLLDYQFDGRRERPLTIIGPPGTRERLDAALEVFFPGASQNAWRYRIDVIDLPCGTPHRFGRFTMESREVEHPSGSPSTGVRLSDGERVLAYSGDTQWTEALVWLAAGADLYISECYKFEGAPVYHLSFEIIEENRARLDAARIVLTHMSAAALERVAEMEAKGYVAAHDGLVLDI